MVIFPTLSSGAVTQYPAAMATTQSVQVIRFLDGSDQRYLSRGRALRQWLIHLQLLNESELQRLEEFFVAQLGDYATFDFPDPFSGVDVPNCRFASPQFLTEYLATDIAASSFWVVETNG